MRARRSRPRAGRDDAADRAARRLPVAGTLAAGAALVALATLPYLGALERPLLHDDRTLLDNVWLLRDAGLREVLAHDYWHGTRHAGSDLYRPLTVLGIAWNARLGLTPASFRAVNVGLHAAATLAAGWVLLLVLTRLGGPRTAVRAAAWTGAALFAVHPLASEAVLFVVGRAETLAAALGLAAFALLAGAAADRRPSWLRIAGSAALLLLALCAKESAAAWLVILTLWWGVGRLAGRPPRGMLVAGLAWVGALAAFLALRAAVVGWPPAEPPWVDNPLVLHGAVARIVNAVRIHALYLGKMVFPHPLSLEYGFDQLRAWTLWPAGLPVALAVAAAWCAVALTLWLRRASFAALFLWAFVPAGFAVTANVLFPIGVIFAERLAYLPLVGACGLGGMLLAALVRRRRSLGILLLLVLLAAAATRSGARGRDLRSHAALVEATAAASPRAVKALANVGRSRLRGGDARGALAPLRRAVELWPEYPRALGLLADALAATGDVSGAAEYRARAAQARARLAQPPGGQDPSSRAR